MLLVCIPQLVNYVTNGSRQARWQEQEWFQRRLLRSLEQQGADLLSAGWQQTTSWQHVYSDKVTAWKPSGTRWELVLSKVTTYLKKTCVTVWRVTFPKSIDIWQKPSSDTGIIETWANKPWLVLLGWIISIHFLFSSVLIFFFISLLWQDRVRADRKSETGERHIAKRLRIESNPGLCNSLVVYGSPV